MAGVVQRSFLAFHFVRMYSTIVSLPHTLTPKPPICGFLWQQYYTDKTFPQADCVTSGITINNVFRIITTLYFEINMKYVHTIMYVKFIVRTKLCHALAHKSFSYNIQRRIPQIRGMTRVYYNDILKILSLNLNVYWKKRIHFFLHSVGFI